MQASGSALRHPPCNDVEGHTVLPGNGLGTNASAWPALLRPDCGVHVVSWNHRGVGVSERPSDPSRVDAMGWSIGVNTAFEPAVRQDVLLDGRPAADPAVRPPPDRGTHFLQMERPAEVHRELVSFREAVGPTP